MQLRIGIVVWSIIAAGSALTGCATGGSSEARPSFMQRCMSNATTKQEQDECAWENASRMAGGN